MIVRRHRSAIIAWRIGGKDDCPSPITVGGHESASNPQAILCPGGSVEVQFDRTHDSLEEWEKDAREEWSKSRDKWLARQAEKALPTEAEMEQGHKDAAEALAGAAE